MLRKRHEEGGAPVGELTDPALGTDEGDLGDGDSSAETENTESRQPPDAVPYSRFKEVNDKLRTFKPFEELVALGYDADSLRRLANWELEFSRDPASAWMTIAETIGDLPTEVREAITSNRGSAVASAPGSNDGKPADDSEVPGWFKPFAEKLERATSVADMTTAERQQSARDRLLDGVLARWDELDKADKIEVPKETKLAYITAVANSGVASTAEELIQIARRDALSFRESVLKGAVKRESSGPRSVPSGGPGSTGNETLAPPKTLEEATARARQAMENGTLVNAE